MRKNLFLFLASASLITVASFQKAEAQYWSLAGNSNATSSSKLGTTNGINLRLFTNNTERVRILYNNGFVGINTTAPNARLHFNTSTGTSLLRGTVDGLTKLYMSSAGGLTVGAGLAAPTNGLYVAGNVGIGTNTPAYKLQVIGTSSFSGQLVVSNGGAYGYNSAGPGVYASGSSYGVYATSSGNYGVYGSGATYGVYGTGVSYGVFGRGYYGLYGQSTNASGYGTVSYGGYGGVYAYGTTTGVYSTGATYGLWGYSSAGYGLYGQSSSNRGIYAYSGTSYGIEAHNNSGSWAATAYGGFGGVYGTGGTYGIYGYTAGSTGLGGYFYSANYYGIRAKTAVSGGYAGVFDGNVYVFGNLYQSSDKNLKKNIADFSDAMSIINKLKPKSYEFRSEGKLASLNLPQGKHFGLIAQELEEVLPNLVKEVDGVVSDNSKNLPQPGTIENVASSAMDPKSPIAQSIQKETKPATDPNTAEEKMTVKSINYIELIPIVIKGMQEQAELIRQQQLQIDDLKMQLSRISGGNTLTSMGSLGQNTPNPVRTSTRIAYSIPSGVNHAQLMVTDNGGKTIKAVSLSPGSNSVNLNTMGLASGIYNYSLMIDGKIVETKKMEIVRN